MGAAQRVRMSWPLVGAAAGALVGGFVDLARGGTTIAAILLVAGYCVAVPAAMLVRGPGERG